MKKKVPLYSGEELHIKLGLSIEGQLPLAGFNPIELEGRRYMCLPANVDKSSKHRLMAECQCCYSFYPASRLELHEPACRRYSKWSLISLFSALIGGQP